MDKMFNPKSIAVIGASETPGKVGYTLMKNLEQFDGIVVPVNPKGQYKSIKDYGYVDLVILAIPARFVIPVLHECGELGIKNVVSITAGFKEEGNVELEEELIRVCEQYDITLIGPNVVGIMNYHNNMNDTFVGMPGNKGGVSFFSQSGAVIATVLDLGRDLGFSKVISLGNKAVVDETDILEYLGEDEDTDVIIGYIEGINDGKRFMKVAKRVTKNKPVILIKSGRTSKGGAAAASHTGTIAGNDTAYEVALKQSGIIRVHSMKDLLNYAKAFTKTIGRIPIRNTVGIITNGGGAGIMTTDDAVDMGLNVIETRDIIGTATPKEYGEALQEFADNEEIHSILLIGCPQSLHKYEDIIREAEKVVTYKPIVLSIPGDTKFPNFIFPEDAMKALNALHTYATIKTSQKEGTYPILNDIETPKEWNKIEDITHYPVVMKIESKTITHKKDVGGVILNIKNEKEAPIAYEKIMAIPGADGVLIQEMLLDSVEVIVGFIKDPVFGAQVMVGTGGSNVELYKDIAFAIEPETIEEAYELLEQTKVYKLLEGYRGSPRLAIKDVINAILKMTEIARTTDLKEYEINPLIVYEYRAVAVDIRYK
jgi:acetate---CoA ligase (ADP-forming)